MSVVCARVYPGEICIAADSMITKDDLKKTNFEKLRVIEELTVGGCGHAEELSLFFQFVADTEPYEPTIKGMLQYMKEFSTYKENFTGNKEIENCYLIVYDNKLFEIDGMFIQEVTDYTAIGEGEPYALTAMRLDYDPEYAVKITSELCTSVSEPVICYRIMTDARVEDFA